MIHYIFVRTDLPVGLAAAQACHAAADSTAAWAETVTKSYLNGPMTLIVLGVESEAELCQVAGLLEDADVDYVPVIEPDLDDEVTAIGVFPGFRHELAPLFVEFRTYQGS